MVIAELDASAPEGLHTDICVIGSGPAGLTIAGELAGHNRRVLVVESGGMEEVGPAPSDEIQSVGYPRILDQRLVRNRIFGGTSHSWAGRCAAFDAIDFQGRSWVPLSSWPLTKEDIEPYEARACAYLGLIPVAYDDRLMAEPGFPKGGPSIDSSRLRHCYWQYSSDAGRSHDFMRFGPAFLAKRPPDVSIMLHATATHLTPDLGNRRILAVELRGRGGRTLTVVPRVVILCGGGIESARLLLNSDRFSSRGVGNTTDMVGRFLMDHPRCTLGYYEEDQATEVRRHYGLFRLNGKRGGNYFARGLSLSPVAQHRHKLLNCAAWLSEDRAADDPWEAAKRLLRGGEGRKLQDAWTIASQPGLVARGGVERFLKGRGLPHKLTKLKLDCIVEQRPDPNSRLTLSDERDEFGLRKACLDWRVSMQERQTVVALGHAISSEMQRLGLPAPTLVDWVRERDFTAGKFVDVCHPTGTTRMSSDPRCGVVDGDCRVHGTENLFIAGSSVFPTSGHANPTLMIVAMAIRVADRLKDEFRAEEGRVTELSASCALPRQPVCGK